MKQLLFSAIIILMAFTSCETERLVGNGSIQTETRLVTGFSKIEVEGTTSVIINQGQAFKVVAKAYSNLLPQLETKLVGDVLKVGYRNGLQVANDNSEVTITLPSLTRLSTSGSSKIAIQNGAASDFKATIFGTSTIKAFGFTVQEANVKIEGSGSAELFVTNSLYAKIIGTGAVYYKGNPTSVSTDITGTGKVEKR